MPLKVITEEGKSCSIHSPEDFQSILNVTYLSHLQFFDEKIQQKVIRACKKAEEKEKITSRQKWLGAFYAQGIRTTPALDLSICWIDSKVGYGLWTNRNIPPRAYIGEYTGILRKRRFLGRWDNHYCFDYTIGEGRRSSYVIDAVSHGNHTRFINHSAHPNLETASVYCEGLLHIIIYALEEILPSTQLCYDYGADYWKKRKKPMLI